MTTDQLCAHCTKSIDDERWVRLDGEFYHSACWPRRTPPDHDTAANIARLTGQVRELNDKLQASADYNAKEQREWNVKRSELQEQLLATEEQRDGLNGQVEALKADIEGRDKTLDHLWKSIALTDKNTRRMQEELTALRDFKVMAEAQHDDDTAAVATLKAQRDAHLDCWSNCDKEREQLTESLRKSDAQREELQRLLTACEAERYAQAKLVNDAMATIDDVHAIIGTPHFVNIRDHARAVVAERDENYRNNNEIPEQELDHAAECPLAGTAGRALAARVPLWRELERLMHTPMHDAQALLDVLDALAALDRKAPTDAAKP